MQARPTRRSRRPGTARCAASRSFPAWPPCCRGPPRGAHGRRHPARASARAARSGRRRCPGYGPPGARSATARMTASGSSSTVRNTSRRVVRVSSHYPFERVNPRLEFDRVRAAGLPPRHRGRLDRALGTRRDADRPPGPGPMSRALASRAPRALRPDDRRPGPARRHRPVGPRGGGPPGPRRRADLGLCQDASARARRRAGPSDSELDVARRGCRRARPGHRRRQGGHRHQGRAHRRGGPGR